MGRVYRIVSYRIVSYHAIKAVALSVDLLSTSPLSILDEFFHSFDLVGERLTYCLCFSVGFGFNILSAVGHAADESKHCSLANVSHDQDQLFSRSTFSITAFPMLLFPI
jgi:hypothetical protein